MDNTMEHSQQEVNLPETKKEMLVFLIRHYTVSVAACLDQGSQGLLALKQALSSNFVVKKESETLQVVALEQVSYKAYETKSFNY